MGGGSQSGSTVGCWADVVPGYCCFADAVAVEDHQLRKWWAVSGNLCIHTHDVEGSSSSQGLRRGVLEPRWAGSQVLGQVCWGAWWQSLSHRAGTVWCQMHSWWIGGSGSTLACKPCLAGLFCPYSGQWACGSHASAFLSLQADSESLHHSCSAWSFLGCSKNSHVDCSHDPAMTKCGCLV